MRCSRRSALIEEVGAHELRQLTEGLPGNGKWSYMTRLLQRSRRTRERGAAAVEFAIVLPVLVLLLVGIFEYGLLFREKLTIASAAASSARTGATMGTRDEADLAILQAVEVGLYDQVNTSVLIKVDIFKADPNTGAKVASNTYTFDGTLGTCKWIPCPDPSLGGTTQYGIPSGWGKPDVRDTTLDPGGSGLDVLGVEIFYHHTALTNMIPGVDRNMSERALVRLEPDAFGHV
jgi:Flp pilus assembly pilin Flp